MKQLTQKLGSGEMKVQEVPIPQLGTGMVLVKNHYSIISAGTEGSTVSSARKSLLAKARERPQQVKQVLETLKSQGPINTYRAIAKKLDEYSPLGYSCSGEVIATGEGVTKFAVGDLVACAGVGYANHAEIVSVPVNLCVGVHSNKLMKEAAYNTLGAIAMQGVRQADLSLGETCVVVGLGLLGQLTCLLLKASGVEVVGVDISKSAVDFSKKNNSVDFAIVRDDTGIEAKIMQWTGGVGADAVIIAAGTNSLDPINFAGSIARKKGTVVALGVIPTGFDRDPHWYRKELDLKMACSYGPGRHDINYEEKGIDYPIAYVRWTENRNMEAFQSLIGKGTVDIKHLTTHEFDFSEAPKAYDLIIDKSESFLGIALKYDFNKSFHRNPVQLSSFPFSKQRVNVSFIGAGSYAQGNLLPNLPKTIGRIAVFTNSGTTSIRVAEKFGFSMAASGQLDIFNDQTNTVFIATRHDSHGKYVIKALEAKKNVFVEKPLCLTKDELYKIISVSQKSKRNVMVGFNRRFSPFATKIKNRFGDGKMSMIYRINAGTIPKEHWLQDSELGGGRIIGEACHFIDFLTFINGSLPRYVNAFATDDSDNLFDTVNLSIKFDNGSIGVVSYFSNGNRNVPKEYIEVNSSGSTAIINDFKELTIQGRGKRYKKKLMNQNKGQKAMVESFVKSIENEDLLPIKMEDTFYTTLATFKAMESLRENGKVKIIEF